MSVFPGVPVDAAYHVVSALAGVLAPLPGGLAAAAAIVGFTIAVRLLLLPLSVRAMRGMEAQARLAPRVRELREKHAGQPDRLRRELAALQDSEGTRMLGGCLPMLLQWPFLSVMYLLFRSPVINGARNSLLAHRLFGAALGSHWLGGAGPVSAQGAVFVGLFLLLAGVGWLSARTAQHRAAPARSAADQPGGARAGAAAGGTTGGGPAPGGTAAGGTAAGSTAAGGTAAALARVAPYVTVVVAAFLPLATGLYLLTTTAWTLAERTLLRGPGHQP